MADRRTTVLLDVKLGDVILPSGGPVQIPAQVSLTAPSGADANKAGGDLEGGGERRVAGGLCVGHHL